MSVPFQHSRAYRVRRFWNWFPMGLAYAFLYWGRYNLNKATTALGDVPLPGGGHGALMSDSDFGTIFAVGTAIYAVSFLVNGPLTDRIGGKRAILAGVAGTAVMNLLMGVLAHAALTSADPTSWSLTAWFSLLYGLNMYFQSFGAVAIVKVNASWFHVRERGSFSGIFGIMISMGIFFAYDVSQYVLDAAGAAMWWVFFAPVIALCAIFLVEVFLLRDRPGQAGHQDFDLGDASSGDTSDDPIPTRELLKKVVTNKVIMTVALVELCTGALRQGVMQWFPKYASTQLHNPETGESWGFFIHNWGLLLMIAGILGGNIAGWVSDKVFGSRRAPVAAILYVLIGLCTLAMIPTMNSPLLMGAAAVLMSLGVIGTHGLLSGTATMDFGGRKGAATAVGLIDGFVYIGSAIQSVGIGNLIKLDWVYWPPFLIPFAVVGLYLLTRIWHAIPKGSRGGH